MKVDRRNRLFVAGGATGTASVYNARTGALLQRYTLTTTTPPTFVNDVTLTRKAAYFTDSRKRQLYVLDLGRRGRLPAAARTLPLTGDLDDHPQHGRLRAERHRRGRPRAAGDRERRWRSCSSSTHAPATPTRSSSPAATSRTATGCC